MKGSTTAQWLTLGFQPIAGAADGDDLAKAGAAPKVPDKFLNPDGTVKTDEVVKAYQALEADHTKKSQEWASWEKDRERLAQWDTWGKSDWPRFRSAHDGLTARVAELEAAGHTAKDAKAIARDEQQLTGDLGQMLGQIGVDDFLDDKRLRPTLANFAKAVQEAATLAGLERVQKWYQEQELQRIDKMATGYVSSVIGLLKLVWPKDLPPMEELLKEAAAANEYDLGKVVASMGGRRKSIEEPAEQRGYQRALEEMRTKGLLREEATAPTGGSQPSAWGPPPTGPTTDGDVFAEVYKEVSAKHGAPLAL